ncbi:tRNA-dihydrouridine synthase [Candidatus Dojkabacteria bacterium]|uniref:tRNA-dihydrouridine synthase n=1 Tax=Candidatus Dojkabacteria bacterium TaxID=2099670 RepID=A0A955KZW6_9BACT|nr:tRNA-dihydrouridine synthase [Candidatus Dojkabacteria bacterium]
MFFDDIPKPIVALSPMDGVTDAPFRFVVNKYGAPDITFTEFVHVMGIIHGSDRLWQDFIFSEQERPVVAQLFGAEPEYFYHASKIVCELGFDGVDINMGCPMRSVTDHGAGAALINTPDLAQQIIREVKRGVKDWYETGELTGISEDISQRIRGMQEARRRRAELSGIAYKLYAAGEERSLLPVSVKTRIGYKEVVVEDWMKTLTEVEPDWISVHGRTLKQMYTGKADWEALARGRRATHLPFLANGDVRTFGDIKNILQVVGADGVLIGKGSYGNPWVFKNLDKLKTALAANTELPEMYLASADEKKQVMLEHVKLHVSLKGEGAFVQTRKHMGWYMNGFPGAAELRKQLMQTNAAREVEAIVG